MLQKCLFMPIYFRLPERHIKSCTLSKKGLSFIFKVADLVMKYQKY